MTEILFSCTIHGLPPITSNGAHRHWRAAAGIRRAWVNRCMVEFMRYRPSKPFAQARCEFVRVSSVEPDDDNLIISFKPVRDALVGAGIIENDKPANMPNPVYRWERGSRGNGYIKIKVEVE